MAGKLRITGGYLLRHLFDVPLKADKGLVRPCLDRVREAIFSSLGYKIKNALVLDLFAGSGAYGFESLSRGSKSVLMVEKEYDVVNCIKNNIKKLNLIKKCIVIKNNAISFISYTNKGNYNLIFLDPPYSINIDLKFWEKLKNFLAPQGIIIYRCNNKKFFSNPHGYKINREKKYGGTYVVFLKLNF